jgi:hypothetical protein
MKLINEKTGNPVQIGDVVHDFRGKAAYVTGWALPRHAGSTGRVHVKEMNEQGFSSEYYPSVYGLKWESGSE